MSWPCASSALRGGSAVPQPSSPSLIEELLRGLGAAASQPVTSVDLGEFLVGVVVAGRCGLATLLRPVPGASSPQPAPVPSSWPATVGELAGQLRSADPRQASIGLAALNAALPQEPALLAAAGVREQPISGTALLEQRAAGRRVAVIGHFPFVERLRATARELWCFELPGAQHPGDHGPQDVPSLLPRAELLAITATTLLNHTLEGLLAHVAPGCFRVLLGPSTPLAPLLLQRGLDALAGARVDDPDLTLAALRQGACYRQVPGVRRVTLLREPA